MTVLRRALLVVALLGSSVVVYACVGDDPAAPGGDGGAIDKTDSGLPPPGDDAGDSGNGAACDGGITCNNVCVPTSSDSKNCGRCAHDCGNGTCAAGVCQPVLVTGDPDGGAVITSVTTDQTDDNPAGLAQHVFWSVSGTGSGVFQDNVTGGNTITLSTTGVALQTNVVVNQSNVYWFAQNFGGAPQPVLKGQVNTAGSQVSFGTMNGPFIQSIMYEPVSQTVLGTYAVTGTTYGAFKCTGGGALCTSLTTFGGQPGGNVANDGTRLYFCDPGDGLIEWSTFSGGSVSSYVLGQATPNLLRVDGTNVYWSNSGTKTIQRGPLGSGSTPKQMTSMPNAANAIAADAVNVYWTDGVTGTVNYAPITGAGPNTPYVTLGASGAMRLVRDTGFLYFSHKGAIYRIALP